MSKTSNHQKLETLKSWLFTRDYQSKRKQNPKHRK